MAKIIDYTAATKAVPSLYRWVGRCPECKVYLLYEGEDIQHVTNRDVKHHLKVKNFIKCPSCKKFVLTDDMITKHDIRFKEDS